MIINKFAVLNSNHRCLAGEERTDKGFNSTQEEKIVCRLYTSRILCAKSANRKAESLFVLKLVQAAMRIQYFDLAAVRRRTLLYRKRFEKLGLEQTCHKCPAMTVTIIMGCTNAGRLLLYDLDGVDVKIVGMQHALLSAVLALIRR